MSKFDLLELLDYIDPANTNYTEWMEVGMALKAEGYNAFHWDEWSKRETLQDINPVKYSKWDSFQDEGITGATITKMAKENGWRSKSDDRDAIAWSPTQLGFCYLR